MEANSKEYSKLQEKSALRLEKMTDRFLSRIDDYYSGKIQEEKTVNYIKHLWAFFKFEELFKIFAFNAFVLGLGFIGTYFIFISSVFLGLAFFFLSGVLLLLHIVLPNNMGIPLFWTVLRLNDRCKTIFEILEGTDIDLEGIKKCFKQSIDPQINIALALLRQIKAIISKDKPVTKNNHKLSPCERYLLLRLIFGDLENKKYDEVYAAMYSVILDVGSSEIQNITSPYNNARRLLMGEVDWDDIKESKQNDLKDALTNIESFLDKEFSSKIDLLWTKLGKKN